MWRKKTAQRRKCFQVKCIIIQAVKCPGEDFKFFTQTVVHGFGTQLSHARQTFYIRSKPTTAEAHTGLVSFQICKKFLNWIKIPPSAECRILSIWHCTMQQMSPFINQKLAFDYSLRNTDRNAVIKMPCRR